MLWVSARIHCYIEIRLNLYDCRRYQNAHNIITMKMKMRYTTKSPVNPHIQTEINWFLLHVNATGKIIIYVVSKSTCLRSFFFFSLIYSWLPHMYLCVGIYFVKNLFLFWCACVLFGIRIKSTCGCPHNILPAIQRAALACVKLIVFLTLCHTCWHILSTSSIYEIRVRVHKRYFFIFFC